MKPKTKKQLLPFDKPWAPVFSRKASKDFEDLRRGLRALVKRFGYLRVLQALRDVASDQTLVALEVRDDSVTYYRDTFSQIDHAVRTIQDLVRLLRLTAEPKKP